MSKPYLRYGLVAALLILIGVLFWWGSRRLSLNSDITSALPSSDPLVNAASRILNQHPALSSIYIDLSMEGETNAEALADAGDAAAKQLAASPLIRLASGRSGMAAWSSLNAAITDNLPLFFSSKQLSEEVAPLLVPETVKAACLAQQARLFELSSVGQASLIEKDPLELRNLVLKRLSPLNPFAQAELYRGHLMTKDKKHLLLIAEPASSARDTTFGRKARALIQNIEKQLNAASSRPEVKISFAGAFRSALDNEEIIKRDTSRAMIVVTLGLLLLVLIGFRRPWIGILGALPALAGLMLATFTYSLFHRDIYTVSLGFAAALIAIAVDHGLADVIMLDQPHETRGSKVSKEVWAVTAFSVYTTLVALLILLVSGIPLFVEVALFACLGVAWSAAFTHVFFPLLFPRLSGSRRKGPLLSERAMAWLARPRSRKVVTAAAAFFVFMLFFARPQFEVNLESMNTVTPETLAAEATIGKAWGELSKQAYLMVEAKTLPDLFSRAEGLKSFIDQEEQSERLSSGGLKASLLPDAQTQEKNLAAWKEFWTRERQDLLAKALQKYGLEAGFSAEAFQPFLSLLNADRIYRLEVPAEILPLFGIYPSKKGDGWLLLDTLRTGPRYQAEEMFKRALERGYIVFDGGYFSRHLARSLNRSFTLMLVILIFSALIMLFLFFVEWKLVFLSFTPLLFATVGTLGTLKLLGLPLSFPSLMIAPVIVGIGMDYGIYMVKSRQRFFADDHPHVQAFKGAIFLGGGANILGTAALMFSSHAVLKAVGISTTLGIFYSMVGAYIFVPFFLDRLFIPVPLPRARVEAGSKEHAQRTRLRFRHLEPHAQFFARFKLLMDPMFQRLASFIRPGDRVLDIGSGYGVPAAWLLTLYPGLEFTCVEPDPARARVAGYVLRDNGRVFNVPAQDLPNDLEAADVVLMLDMAHYLDDDELERLLRKVHALLTPKGRLVIRVTVPIGGRRRWQRWLETAKLKASRLRPYYRDEKAMEQLVGRTGFEMFLVEPTAAGREETWFIAVKP